MGRSELCSPSPGDDLTGRGRLGSLLICRRDAAKSREFFRGGPRSQCGRLVARLALVLTGRQTNSKLAFCLFSVMTAVCGCCGVWVWWLGA